ncbi:MAG: hypothetical protein J7604_15785 [Sporocytophaga sp.]|nr:hypothetical protein [Sporocytophaga sp.]
MWGYNRDMYSRSTLHFAGSNPNGSYDFKVEKARAHDQPDMDNFFRTPPTVPQYNLNIGFMFNEKKGWGIEGSWNHLKYVMNDNEVRHVKGEIYGQRIDKDTLITPDFVKFEHTNGNNYLMISLVKRLVIYESKNKNLRFGGLVKPGGGVLIPKTDSRVLGYHNDGPFKLSGIVIGVTGSLRIDLFKYFFLDTGLQAAEAFYTWGKIYNGRVKHNFLSLQYTYAAGINIPIGHKL